jgi:hypothetical protein
MVHIYILCVGANGCMCIVLGENWELQFFLIICYNVEYYRWPCAYCLWSVLLDFLWWTCWSCSYLFSYVGVLLHIGVLFMVLFSGFLLKCSFVASTYVVFWPHCVVVGCNTTSVVPLELWKISDMISVDLWNCKHPN